MNATTRITSIQHPLAIDSGLGSVKVEGNFARHVEQLMLQVLFTGPGERINRPDFGCGVRRLLFAPNSTVAANMAQITIFQGLQRWLGDVISVEEVDVSGQDNQLNIKITYLLKARQEKRILNLELL